MNGFCLRGDGRVLIPSTSRWRQARALLASLAIVLLVGCSTAAKPSSVVTIRYEFTPQPARTGTITATFTLTDAASRPIVGAHLTAEADMTHAGMSPTFAAVEETQPGRYESSLALGMAGDWVILVHGTLPTGEKLERQFELSNVRPN